MLGPGAASGGPGDEFSALMQQACAIKGEQVKQDRRKWESKPNHVKHSLFHDPGKRGQDIHDVKEKLEIAEGFKATAKTHFTNGRYREAIDQYERALGCFTYYTTREPDWKKKGIKDEDLTLHDVEPDNHDVKLFKAACLSNIAACHLKLAPFERDYKECVRVCTCALEFNPSCAKALYRRAQARTLPASSGATEFSLAEIDLKRCYKLDPTNITVKRELKRIIQLREKQALSDKKTYHGMFDRASLDFNEEQENKDEFDDSTMKEEERARKAESQMYMELSKKYEREGDLSKAEELAKASALASSRPTKIERKKAIKQREQWMNWENPSEEQITDAKQHGIDLTDPLVRAELTRISREKEKGNDPILTHSPNQFLSIWPLVFAVSLLSWSLGVY